MSESAKRKTLGFLLLGFFLTALLAAGLSQLELHPGLPFPAFDKIQGVLTPLEEPPMQPLSVRGILVFGVLLAALVLYLLYRLVRGAAWKELLSPSLYLGLLFLVVVGLLLALLAALTPSGQLEAEQVYLPPPVEVVTGPLGATPAWLLWLVWGGLAILAALLGIGLVRAFRAPQPRDPFGWEAEQALHALQDGQDLSNVILQCYRRMSRVLAEEQGIERGQAMTAAEFERLLAGRGFPPGPVHQLTRLFEAVRYGRWQPGPQHEQAARDCLMAIAQASQARQEAQA